MNWSKQIRTAWAAAAATALVLSANALGAADKIALVPAGASPRVSVAGTGNRGYRVVGTFRVNASSQVAWSVLTDYDNLSSFVSSMRSSSAARPEAGRLLVTQEAVGRA